MTPLRGGGIYGLIVFIWTLNLFDSSAETYHFFQLRASLIHGPKPTNRSPKEGTHNNPCPLPPTSMTIVICIYIDRGKRQELRETLIILAISSPICFRNYMISIQLELS